MEIRRRIKKGKIHLFFCGTFIHCDFFVVYSLNKREIVKAHNIIIAPPIERTELFEKFSTCRGAILTFFVRVFFYCLCSRWKRQNIETNPAESLFITEDRFIIFPSVGTVETVFKESHHPFSRSFSFTFRNNFFFLFESPIAVSYVQVDLQRFIVAPHRLI